VKFSWKLLGNLVRRHIKIKSDTLNVQSSKCPSALNMNACSRLRKFWTALTTGFWGKSFHIISSLVRRSSIVDGLLSSSFCLRERKNCNADYVSYQFNSETCRRRYLTDARWFFFQQDGAPAHRACDARLVTRHCNDFIAKHEWATKLARS